MSWSAPPSEKIGYLRIPNVPLLSRHTAYAHLLIVSAMLLFSIENSITLQPSPVRLKTKWRFLSDYSFYVRSFLTRAALHAARSTKALY